jgi:hypothetical protein
MMSGTDRYNDFAKEHGARKEVWDEALKFKFQSKSLHEFTASVYGMPFQEFPDAALTSEKIYHQWCAKVARIMPQDRSKKEFKQYMNERLLEAEKEEIPPNTEEGVEVGVVVLAILLNAIQNCRDFDKPQDDLGQELRPGEWVFIETSEDSKCGQEVYIKYEGLKARVVHQMCDGGTETRLTRKQIVKWLMANGRYYDKTASVNRRRCAYVLPLELVESHEVFSFRGRL